MAAAAVLAGDEAQVVDEAALEFEEFAAFVEKAVGGAQQGVEQEGIVHFVVDDEVEDAG